MPFMHCPRCNAPTTQPVPTSPGVHVTRLCDVCAQMARGEYDARAAAARQEVAMSRLAASRGPQPIRAWEEFAEHPCARCGRAVLHHRTEPPLCGECSTQARRQTELDAIEAGRREAEAVRRQIAATAERVLRERGQPQAVQWQQVRCPRCLKVWNRRGEAIPAPFEDVCGDCVAGGTAAAAADAAIERVLGETRDSLLARAYRSLPPLAPSPPRRRDQSFDALQALTSGLEQAGLVFGVDWAVGADGRPYLIEAKPEPGPLPRGRAIDLE